MANNIVPPIAIPAELKLEDFLPMMPDKGPPLPSFLGIYWPWYKVPPEIPPEVPPEEPPEEPPGEQPLTELTDSDVVISRLLASPQVVEIGQKVTISVNVGNPNDFAGSYLVKLSGAIIAEQGVVLDPHETKKVIFQETVDWEGYRDIHCLDLSVTVRGEKVIVGPPPPGAYVCPECGAEFDSDREVGFHLATEHFGYSASGVPCNDQFIGDLGSQLWIYQNVDKNPDLAAKANWALDNASSGDLLIGCTSYQQKRDIHNYMVYQLGMDTSEAWSSIFSSYYWDNFRKVNDLAPGWTPENNGRL